MDDRFKLIKEIPFVVPSSFIHESCLADFAKNHKREFCDFHPHITDANFSRATDKLTPGKKYITKFIAHDGFVRSDDCLKIYEYHKALYVGVQGLSVIYEVAKDELQEEKAYVSFDKKDNFPCDRRVPCLHHYSGGFFEFNLNGFDYVLGDYILVIICEYSE